MPYDWKSLQKDFIDNNKDFGDAINDPEMDTLVIDASVTLSIDETVPASVRLYFINGAKLTIATGKTLTINGKLDAGLFQIFALQGTGKVVIEPSACTYLLPEWWGAVADGTTDCTAAFQAAVDTSDRLAGTGEHQYTYNKPIFLAGRRYKIAGTITSKQGALFIGQGPTGANAELCTSIYHDPPAYPTTGWDRNLFVWDAGTGYSSEASGCAVGGGLKNLNIAKATGKYGGKAIYMKARAATHRPTEFKFENLIISAEGYSSNPKRLDVWDRIMHVDGTSVSDENGYGLRNTTVMNLRCAHGRDEVYFLLQQVTSFATFNLHADAAGAADAEGNEILPTLKFTDACESIRLIGCGVTGTLWFDSSVGTVFGTSTIVPCQTIVSGKFKVKVQVDTTNVIGAALVTTDELDLVAGCPLAIIGATSNNYFGKQVGVGTNVPGAMLQVNTLSSANKGIIVHGAGTQSANYLEWQDGNGDAVGYVDAQSNLWLGPPSITTNLARGINQADTTPGLSWFETDAAVDSRWWDMFVASAKMSWKLNNDAGTAATTFLEVSRTGTSVNYVVFPNGQVGIGSAGQPTAKLDVVNDVAGRVGLLVKGASAQTANLQEWRSSGSPGTLFAQIASDGKLTLSGANPDPTVTPTTTTTTTIGDKDARLLLVCNSLTAFAGGEVILGCAADTEAGRYGVIGADIRANSLGQARGDVYIATKHHVDEASDCLCQWQRNHQRHWGGLRFHGGGR
jgi:hypothetical protein